MSHVEPHSVGARLTSRLGRRYQVRGVLGIGRAIHDAPWQLNREPFHHMLPPWGLPQELELAGDEASVAPGGAPRAPTPPRPVAGAETCEQRTYVLRVYTNAGADQLSAVCTGILPTPCVITNIYTLGQDDAAGDFTFWGLALVDGDVTGEHASAFGQSLHAVTVNDDVAVASEAQFSPFHPLPWNGGTNAVQRQLSATGRFGDVIDREGSRLCIWQRAFIPGATIYRRTYVITVQQLPCGQPLEFRTTASRAARAPATARAPSAPSPAIAAAPTTVSVLPGGISPTSPRAMITRPVVVTPELAPTAPAPTAGEARRVYEPQRFTAFAGVQPYQYTTAPALPPAPARTRSQPALSPQAGGYTPPRAGGAPYTPPAPAMAYQVGTSTITFPPGGAVPVIPMQTGTRPFYR